MKTKHPVRSKLNWLGLSVVLVAAAPELSAQVSQILPPYIALKICGGLGLLVILVRTYLTSAGVSFDAPIKKTSTP